jgi:Dit-like phage tail protein
MGIIGKLRELLTRARGCKILSMQPTGIIDVVELDLVTSVSVEWPGQVIDNPLEREESFSHAIYRGPLGVTVEGLFTDNPLEFLAGALPAATAKSKLRKLIELRDREEPVSAVLSIDHYLDLGIESVGASKDPDMGDGVGVTIVLRRLNIVSTALVPSQFDLDALIAGGGGLADFGTQAPIDPRSYSGPTAVTFPG